MMPSLSSMKDFGFWRRLEFFDKHFWRIDFGQFALGEGALWACREEFVPS